MYGDFFFSIVYCGLMNSLACVKINDDISIEVLFNVHPYCNFNQSFDVYNSLP